MQFTSEIKKTKGKSQIFKKISDGVIWFEFEGEGGNKVNKNGKEKNNVGPIQENSAAFYLGVELFKKNI